MKKKLIFFLEGFSEKVFLEGLMPQLLPSNIEPDYKIFEGKKDLEKKLFKRLNGWNTPDCVFVILLDQDQEDCKELKQRLISKCKQSDKPLKNIIIRIACHELESWYFGDLSAVGKALNKPNLSKQYKNRSKYKQPDKIQRPAIELERITNKRYQKIAGSRAISPLLDINNNQSPSFKVFIKGIRKLIQQV